MKTRMGFVSNSSSTSYLVILPQDFSIEQTLSTQNLKKIKTNATEWQFEYLDNNKTLKQDLEYLLEKGFIISEGGYGEDADPVCFDSLVTLLEPYIVEERECGSDNQSWMVLIDKSRSTGKKLTDIKPPRKERLSQ